MNNILSFNEYNGQELEVIAYENVLNEKSSMGKGIKGFLNRRASMKVRSELEDEIEMSKEIMEGIKNGLESISDNFDAIQKSLDNTDNDKKKGKKQKLLDDITKILENSKKSTWDLNELIDEGEIDYTGFTANVAISSVAYFGILLTPFRATMMIHKGYKYFFNIVKNTIRKALVMLQLNFDQFSNLIVTQSMRAAGVITATDTSNDIGEFYGNIMAQISENKSLSKKQYDKMKKLLDAAKAKFDQQVKADKMKDNAENMFNNLDPYNNTYTESLKALRQYASEDVQKQLDSIKAAMNKLAGQEADLQAYAELLIASAEEHAYEVSTSIYNKFAKMTEVFSLPNQQKLIDLILAANKEEKKEAKRIRDEKKKNKDLQDKIEENRKKENGVEIFKSLEGVEIGELEGEEGPEVRKYDPSKIKAKNWTYSEFRKRSKDEQESLDCWLQLHPEVLKECDETLQIYIDTPFKNSFYIDSLIDYVGVCLDNDSNRRNESYILNFDDYLFESSGEDEDEEEEYELSDDDKKEIDSKIDDAKNSFSKLFELVFGEDVESFEDVEMTAEKQAKLNYIISKFKDSEEDEEGDEESDKDDGELYEYPSPISKLMSFQKKIDKSKKNKKYYLDMTEDKIDNNQVKILKKLYSNKKVASVALVAIGRRVLRDNTFTKNSDNIVSIINKCITSNPRKVRISLMTYVLLEESIKELKRLRTFDYSTLDDEPDNSEQESEKSGS